MKLITDPEIINYRIALQQQMYRATGDMSVLMRDFRNKVQKNKKITEQDLRFLKNQISLIASMFYELEFGNYFSKQSKDFQKKVINNLTKTYFKNIFNKSIEDIMSYTLLQVYTDMEDELNRVISSTNGK